MNDPFKITGPAAISFSGGRTSGLMLYRILEAHGGTLPEDVKVLYENTGKEREETLDFVERCSQEWGVPIVWLEYRYEGSHRRPLDGTETGRRKTPGKHTFTVVDYATASRNGEPFEAVITARGMLPNVVMRFCTVEMKIRTSQRYLKSLGWDYWTNCIGFRADEPHRVAKLMNSNRHTNEDPVAPLAKAGITQADVMEFWKSQPFDLQLQPHEGNCDLCFLKGTGKLETILRAKTELADWWIAMEKKIPGGHCGTARFRNDRPSYAALLELSKRAQIPGMEDEADELSIACHCTD